MLHQPARFIFVVVALVAFQSPCGAGNAAVPLIVFTADAAGEVSPCESCPLHAGRGGLARRATLVAQLRAQGPSLLLLDAGNFLYGPESVASGGRVVVEGYDALKYDAVNLAWGDLALGKDAALETLKGAKFVVLSANILDDATGAPLATPFTVKKVADARIAIIGVCEPPAGLDYLPRLKRQLKGVRFQPPEAAVTQWLPKARAESDAVVCLYYGGSDGLAALREKFAGDLAATLVGGAGIIDQPPAAKPTVAIAEEHGKSLGCIDLTAVGGHAAAQASQLPIDGKLEADKSIVALLAPYQSPGNAILTSSDGTALPIAVPAPTTQAQIASNTASAASPAATLPAAQPRPIAPTTPTERPAAPPPPAESPNAKRIPAHQDLEPKGLPGVGLTAEQVNSAIDRGSEALWNYIKSKDLEAGHQRLGDDPSHVLACLALVHAGAAKKFPDFDAALRAYLDRYPPNSYQTIYQYGLGSMLIEAYGDPTYLASQRRAARYIIEAQGARGTWTYTAAVPVKLTDEDDRKPLRAIAGVDGAADPAEKGMARATEWSVNQDGDNSCSQFALLGAHAASRCHVKIAPELWKRSLGANRERQLPDGGWAYHEAVGSSSYGSMTCAGICALAINQFELGDSNPRVDPAIERGLGWLDAHFSVSRNPEEGSYLYYYLYSLERVGRILDTEFIGAHEWYPLGARFLVDQQRKDSTWVEASETDPRNSTSFALLFLTRATPKLNVTIKHGGPGKLKADVESPPPTRLYVILDASGSMLDIMDGRQKFDLARSAVQALIDRLPDSTEVALRVYGHRKRSIEPGSDEDTALEIPMGALDRVKFAAKLKSLRPRGKTPLTLSLTDAMSDLSGAGPDQPVTLILLTDGGEDTMPRRDPVKACDKLAQMKGITFHIVGFDINQEDWGLQLRGMAQHSGGQYWPAAGASALSQNLIAAVFGRPEEFVLFDAANREVSRGLFGKTIELPEGKYQFKTTFAGGEFLTPVTITTDSTTAVLFDASRVSTQAPATTRPAPAAGPIASRFCTQCGHALPPGAKFCPVCGHPVGK